MSGRIKRNDPCPCGSGKKYKKCCLGKVLSNRKENSIYCYECGKFIAGSKPDSYFVLSTDYDKEFYYCNVCYREMSCGVCGRKLELKSFIMDWYPDREQIHIECRECIIDRIRRQNNIPYWEKIKVGGGLLMRRSRTLIRASLTEELPSEIIFGQDSVIENKKIK